jgi:hypothetical protein
MSLDMAKRFIVVFAATSTVAACSSSSNGVRSGIDARDAWASSADLEPSKDVSDAPWGDSVAAGPDAAAPNRDGVAQDSALPERDAGRDADHIPPDVASIDGIRSDGKGTADGSGSLACRATLGGLAPLVESEAPGAMSLADVDGDGRLDVISGYDVRLGKGNGSFGPALSFGLTGQTGSLALGDVDNDGKLDIVVVGYSTQEASILLGHGDGTFATGIEVTVGSSPATLADVDGDGKLDILTADLSSDTVWVLLGRGGGNFTAEKRYPTGNRPGIVLADDVNHDGKLDLIVLNNCGNWVDVLLNRGDGTFADKQEFPVVAASQCPMVRSAALGDVDQDGKPDLVVATAYPGLVNLLLGKGDGTVAPMTVVSTDRTSTVSVGDLDRDGKLDIVAGNDWTDSVTVMRGKGDGTFAVVANTTTTWDDARSFVVTDWDRDGILDLLSSGNSTSVLLGKGDGTFAGRLTYPVSSGSMASADLNADGRPDLVVRAGTALVGVLLNLCQ